MELLALLAACTPSGPHHHLELTDPLPPARELVVDDVLVDPYRTAPLVAAVVVALDPASVDEIRLDLTSTRVVDGRVTRTRGNVDELLEAGIDGPADPAVVREAVLNALLHRD